MAYYVSPTQSVVIPNNIPNLFYRKGLEYRAPKRVFFYSFDSILCCFYNFVNLNLTLGSCFRRGIAEGLLEDCLGNAPSTQGLRAPCSTSELAIHNGQFAPTDYCVGKSHTHYRITRSCAYPSILAQWRTTFYLVAPVGAAPTYLLSKRRTFAGMLKSYIGVPARYRAAFLGVRSSRSIYYQGQFCAKDFTRTYDFRSEVTPSVLSKQYAFAAPTAAGLAH